jgi:hypothetical protein
MERWIVGHRTARARFYYETKYVIQTERRLGQQFNVLRHGAIPSCNTILIWTHKFEDTGSVRDVPHGAPRTVGTEEDVRRVRESFQRTPHRSTRQKSRILGNLHYQQDGATARTATRNMDVVRSLFHKVISHFWRHPMASTFAGPHGTGLLSVGISERTSIQKSPPHNTGPETCNSR